MELYKGESFLDKLYRDLYTSKEVTHRVNNINDKYNNIATYLKRLEKVHLLATTSNRSCDLNRLRNLYYDKYIIKESDIPDTYYQKHSNYSSYQAARKLIDSQKESFDVWFDFLNSSEALKYPMWVRYYTFRGMLSLGSFDSNTKKFNKREKNTTALFPPFESSIVTFIMKSIYEVVEGKSEVDDKIVLNLLKSGSFKRLYEFFYNKLISTKKLEVDTNKGVWKLYKRGSNYQDLLNDLYHKGTFWCIEVNKEDAKDAINSSDLYIYYSYDLEGNLQMARSAIRVASNEVIEVRGISNNQNLEDDMLDITIEKAKEFYVNDSFLTKFAHSRKVREILSKDNLDVSDLRFLYEVDEKINFLGYKVDNRLLKLRESRDLKRDLAVIFTCDESKIGVLENDLQNNDLVCYYGDISYCKDHLDGIFIPPYVVGDLSMRLLKSSLGLDRLEVVSGNLCLDSLEEVNHLGNLRAVNGIDCDNIIDRVKLKEGDKDAKKNRN